jgi:S1-C subfamily serine protease
LSAALYPLHIDYLEVPMAEVLSGLSSALAAAVEAAGPSIVRMEGRERVPATGIVWSADGVILTAHHVVEQEENLHVGLADGQTIAASLAGRDATTDIAVLRAEASGLAGATWAAAEDLRVGHLVLALGRPGRSVMATLGVVSALGSAWRTPAGGQLDRYVQTDVTMYPGFSGGPLVDANGKFVGMNSSALLRGVSMTVPATSLRTVVETLLTHGRVRRGYLGIGAQPVRLPPAIAGKAGQETGLLLVSVEAGSPADSGGLLLGDTIVALDGQPTRHLDDLLALLSGDRVGRAVPVRIVRGGQAKNVQVTIGEQK